MNTNSANNRVDKIKNSSGFTDIINIVLLNPLTKLRIPIEVYPDNTLGQIYEGYGELLGVAGCSVIFINERTNEWTAERDFNVEKLNLKENDTLAIARWDLLDATTSFHFGIVYNTLYRLKMSSPRDRNCYHELYIGSSSNQVLGHEIKFFIKESCLIDIINPYYWKSEWYGKWYGTDNPLTHGKDVVVIVNETSGKCAMPEDFDMPIYDFVKEVDEPASLYLILKDDYGYYGSHLDRFSFGE